MAADKIRQLRYRTTDEMVIEKAGIFPLSVAAGRIAVTAMRAARLFAATATSREAIARARTGDGRFVETFPAAALAIWGFPATGYKGPRKRRARARLVGELAKATSAWLTLSDQDRSRCEDSDDMLDALVAALVARAREIDCCVPIPSKDLDRAKVEGWIALPQPGSLDDLIGQ